MEPLPNSEVVEQENGHQRFALPKQLQKLPRNTVLAFVGLGGLAYDGAKNFFDQSKEVFDRAEDRGEEIETDTRERVRKVVKRAEAEAEEEIEEIAEAAPLPTAEQVASLHDKLAQVTEKLDILVAREKTITKMEARLSALERQLQLLGDKLDQMVTVKVEEVVNVPFADYDELTAREIVARMDGLHVDDLLAIRQYEQAHDNRVTVLRKADELLEEAEPVVV